MKKPLLDRLIERPHTRADTVTWIVLYVIIIAMMANLPPMVDRTLHPEVPYLDYEHLIVGGTVAVATFLLFGTILFYSVRLHKANTRLQAAEISRKAIEERYRDLFMESRDPVFIMTSDGDFIDMNPAGVRLLGYDRVEDVARANLETSLGADRESLSRFYSEVDKVGFIRDHELTIHKRDGEQLVVAISASVVLDGEGSIGAYRCFMRDMTDENYLKKQVMNAQRMESLSQLARGVAHQYNNVITTIQGYAELVAGEVADDSKAAQGLAQIQSAAEHAERLTRELMVFSRQSQLRPRPLKVNQLVEASREMLQHIAGEDVVLTTVLYAEPSVASVDAASMEGALFNLVLFSRERMRGQGAIKVTTGRSHVDDEHLRVQAQARVGEFVTITVEDNGPLIGPDERLRIFEPFTDSRGGSAGMEMSVVYGVVMNHDGWVEVDSTPVRTRFTIYLPSLPDVVDGGGADPVVRGDMRGKGQKVLLVEDEDAVRIMAETTLSNNGYVVFTARNASDAFRIFAREKGEIDAVFADVVMPGESGVNLADHLAEYNAGLSVILTSGAETTVDDWRSIEAHGYRFLPKPYRLTDLLREMNDVFNDN